MGGGGVAAGVEGFEVVHFFVVVVVGGGGNDRGENERIDSGK